jgi:UMF1 family MFS transporter
VALASVGVWWLVFTVPFWRRVREPARMLEPDETADQRIVRVSIRRLRETFGELRPTARRC